MIDLIYDFISNNYIMIMSFNFIMFIIIFIFIPILSDKKKN